MKSILKINNSIVLLFALPIIVSAQKDVKKYKEEADAIRLEVWGWNKPEFKVRDVPAAYANVSKVIIAKHEEIDATSKNKFKAFGFNRTGAYTKLTVTETSRELIKINDKSAVSEYSELSFTKARRYSGTVIDNSITVYVGVRVIKSDGKIKEVNKDDIIITKDNWREEEAKLAIPDLQVGDILDYFFVTQKILELESFDKIGAYTFTLFDDAPIMHYSVHCEIGKKYAVEYRCYNGADDFKRSTNEDDDNIFDLVKKNITPFSESNLWTSPYRQLPILRMSIMMGYKGIYAGRINAREPGKVYKNQDADEFIQDRKNSIAEAKKLNYRYSLDKGILNNYYKNVIKNKKTMAIDSFLSEMFYIFRFRTLLDVGDGSIPSVLNRFNVDYNPDALMFNFAYYLRADGVGNQLILITPITAPRITEIMGREEIDYLLIAQGSQPRVFNFPNMFGEPFTIPYYYENTRQAVTLDIGDRNDLSTKKFEVGTMDIPGSNAVQNNRTEKLDVSILMDGSNLELKRKTILKGHYKLDVQKNLILFEDYHESERKAFGITNSIIQQLEENKHTKKFAGELQTAFDQERGKQKEKFTEEAKSWFEQEISELSDYKVENLGVRHTSPEFIYSSKFKMGGAVKKAGNNLIIEVGKLQGSPLKIDNDQRKRRLDVYMPFARSIQFEITLRIPEGYTAEGVTSLNKKVENETGYFIAEASSDDKQITIHVKKSYHHSFEPATNWDKLLVFIDAANDWGNSKILLKKK